MKRLEEIIRELTTVEEDYILLEGQDYEGMLQAVFSFLDKQIQQLEQQGLISKDFDKNFIQALKPKVEEYIKEARSKLKKNDRIIRFLKLCRINILQQVLFNVKNIIEIDDFKNALTQYITKESKEFNNPSEIPISSFTSPAKNSVSPSLAALAHYLSLPIPEIQNTVFLKQNPSEIMSSFHDYEKEWEEKQVQITSQEEHHEVVLKFPDGKAWFNLNQEYCEKEGKAMGHCGNKAAYSEGDTVLSLREPVKSDIKIDDKNYPAKVLNCRPLLTFILHQDGNLGEMKGRGNQKPAPQYHNYIIELLKLPIIEGISGGGYAAERNFSMKDLPQNERNELYEVKPALAPLTYQYEKNGFNAFLRKRALTKMVDQIPDLESSGHNVTYNAKDKLVILEKFNNLKQFLEDCGVYDVAGRKDNAISNVMDYYNGDNTVDYEPEVNFSEIKDFIDNLPEEYKVALETYVKKKYKTETEDSSDIAQTLEENSDETFDLIRSSLIDGYRAGYEDEMFKDFKKTIMGWTAEGMYLKFQFSGDHPQFDEPVELIMNPNDFFDTLDEGKANYCFMTVDEFPSDEAPYLDEPRYGWSGYDSDVAMERFKSELSDEIEKFIPKIKKPNAKPAKKKKAKK